MHYTTDKQNIPSYKKLPRLLSIVEGKLTYVRGHGKGENHVAIAL